MTMNWNFKGKTVRGDRNSGDKEWSCVEHKLSNGFGQAIIKKVDTANKESGV